MNDTTTADSGPDRPLGLPLNDQLGQASEARWYCLDRDGVAMLCKDEEDARAQAVENDDCWPQRAPHRAALLGDMAAERGIAVDVLGEPVQPGWRRELGEIVDEAEATATPKRRGARS